ncbi:dystrobrevin beta-like isoform X3 [Mizuhopecten yessoensis]|uniref:dystrobrevin beta-like isoform X3 n=1 Tax=Mizuhopecten yessoensis TaxID=6573 RepID=UPI000B4586BF|nr:dystrobrevin beta-like isoform X3 [Mizuhopecten yessoensis]
MECLAYNQQKFASVIHNINKELNDKGYIQGNNAEDENKILEDLSPASDTFRDNRQLVTEMRGHNFDVIRFATYRTACKLRFVQKKTNLYLVDIWNIIEAFRENGLNTLEPESELNGSRVESVLSSIFCHLNKRLPSPQQVDNDQCIQMLLSWLINAYDSAGRGRIRVFCLKVALSHMCAGKLMDKLRYIFTQLSDSSGYLNRQRFEDYLRDLLTLPTAVFEGPSFGYNEMASRACFDGRSPVNVNDFLNVMMSDPGPQCLMWLPILNRMAQVENVFHPVQCEGCHRESFMGFRYKCQRCYNYQLCQDCFWRGRTSGNHSNDHDMKEYTSYKSAAKQIGHNLKKSIKCVPTKANQKIPHFPDTPEKTMDLSYIVPPTPQPPRNGFHQELPLTQSSEVSSVDSGISPRSPSKANVDTTRIDDEHRLIARYAARLAADVTNATAVTGSRKARSPTELSFSLDGSKAQRELISQLEAKNREIMREIQRLRLEQEAHAKSTADAQYNPTLLAELRLLRQRKDELENRMQALQESRKELMLQLEGLMKLLKNHPTSPRSTPNESPRSQTASLPPTSYAGRASAPTTPAMESSMLSGVGGDVRQAFSQPTTVTSVRHLRNDLLVAADSVTSAMSSLVKELNSESENTSLEENWSTDTSASDEEDDDGQISEAEANLVMADSYVMRTQEELDNWQQEVLRRLDQEQDFISQLRARRAKSTSSSHNQSDTENDNYIPENSFLNRTDDGSALGTDDAESYIRTDDESCIRTDDEDAELYDNHPKELPGRMTSSTYTTDEESYLQSDADSYIRTDDEEGGNTDWEESMKRWVNR